MQESTMGISGHRGAGVVVTVAADVRDLCEEGDRVGIKWICPKQLNPGFTVTGYETPLSDGVKEEEARPILCGGVTADTACRRSQVRAGQWNVLMGAGGGLGHLAIRYTKVIELRIIAVDAGAEKKNLCLSLGAEHFIDNTSTQDVPAEFVRIMMYGAHGEAVFATSVQSYALAPYLLRPGGTMVAVGILVDQTVVAGFTAELLAIRSLNVVGAVTVTLKQLDEAFDFVARRFVEPTLVYGTLHNNDDMFEKTSASHLAGRAVIKVYA